jgi:hypothetical protein
MAILVILVFMFLALVVWGFFALDGGFLLGW